MSTTHRSGSSLKAPPGAGAKTKSKTTTTKPKSTSSSFRGGTKSVKRAEVERTLSAAYYDDMRPFLDISGDFTTTIRLKARFAFGNAYAQTSLNAGGVFLSGSKDGTTTGTWAPNSFGMNPFRMPCYVVNGGGASWDTGVAVADSLLAPNLCLNFSKYRIHGFRLDYQTYSPSSEDGGWLLAFDQDPCNIPFGLQDIGPNPTTAQLDNSMNCVAVPSWLNWTVHFPVDSSRTYFMWTPTLFSSAAVSTPFAVSALRDTCFGAFSMLVANTVASANSTGRLWITYDLELTSPLGSNSSYVSPGPAFLGLEEVLLEASKRAERRAAEEKKLVHLLSRESEGKDELTVPAPLVRTDRRSSDVDFEHVPAAFATAAVRPGATTVSRSMGLTIDDDPRATRPSMRESVTSPERGASFGASTSSGRR